MSAKNVEIRRSIEVHELRRVLEGDGDSTCRIDQCAHGRMRAVSHQAFQRPQGGLHSPDPDQRLKSIRSLRNGACDIGFERSRESGKHIVRQGRRIAWRDRQNDSATARRPSQPLPYPAQRPVRSVFRIRKDRQTFGRRPNRRAASWLCADRKPFAPRKASNDVGDQGFAPPDRHRLFLPETRRTAAREDQPRKPVGHRINPPSTLKRSPA